MIENLVKILLVEDNRGDARLIRELLNDAVKTSFLVTNVPTLSEAFAEAEKPDYDIILLDLSLPDSFGLETLRSMLDQVKNRSVPIIVLTGLDDIDMGIKAVEEGAQDYLSKGDVDSKLLARSINYALTRHESEEKLRRSEQEYRSLIDDVFETSMVAVLILDQNYKIVWCNEATEIYFHIKKEYLIGRDKRKLVDSELKCIFADPDDYSSRLLEAYEKRIFTDRFECKVFAEGDREERWLEHWSQPISEGIYIDGWIEQYLDITDRKLLEVAEKEQREFAEALSDISKVIASSLNLDHVLSEILNNLTFVVPHDVSSIYLINYEESDQDQHLFQDHRNHSNVNESDIAELSKHFLKMMSDQRNPILVGDILAEDMPPINQEFDLNVRSFLSIPIQFQDKMLGSLNLMSDSSSFFNKEHSERLTAFAELCAVSIQNAYLFEQSRSLGQFNERQRLARDLHDSVSQTLFSCQTIAEAALRRWGKDPEKTKELIQDVQQLTTTALIEMRVLLLELRPQHLVNTDIKQLFIQYLEPLQSRRGFDLNLEIDDIVELPPNVKITIYRITQEALNNVFKHADASMVGVKLVDQTDQIELEIADNGSGFDFGKVGSTSLGLNIIKERAESINADLKITSDKNSGTQVSLVWHKG